MSYPHGKNGQLLLILIISLLGFTATADSLSEALDHPDRPAADRERDANSLPAAVLQFARLPESGVVVDLFGGGGYYSEIMARAMSDDSTVYLHNNAAYLGFSGDALDQRLQRNRLPTVVRYDREIDAFDLPADSVDLVITVLTYHDIYYKTDGWDLKAQDFFGTIHNILKPGGTLLVIDHVAAADTGSAAAQDLHRIDPAFALADISSHGFEFAGESEVLKNDADPLDVSVFDPSIRRKTSRFIYKFIEPAD